MMKKQAYTCDECGKGAELNESSATPPECCNKTMTPVESLPVCEQSDTAEHSRLADDNDPCNDSRGGR